MSLEEWDGAHSLYLTRGDEVSSYRPWFTGDVFEHVSVPAIDDTDLAIVIAHPCSMRAGPNLKDRILVAAVRTHEATPAHKWTDGYFNRMPLPELHGDGAPFHAAWLEDIGVVRTGALELGTRIACLSPFGVNVLQQRLVHNLTRLEVGTSKFWEAFSRTYEESDLLEEWTEGLSDMDQAPAVSFETWIGQGTPTRRKRLEDAQHRSQVRSDMRAEIRRIRGAT